MLAPVVAELMQCQRHLYPDSEGCVSALGDAAGQWEHTQGSFTWLNLHKMSKDDEALIAKHCLVQAVFPCEFCRKILRRITLKYSYLQFALSPSSFNIYNWLIKINVPRIWKN